MKHTQLVLVEFKNSCPGIYEIESKKKITLEKVVEYFEENNEFDEEEDSITFVDKPTKIKI